MGTSFGALYWLCLHKCCVPSNAKLWQVSWQSFLDGVLPAQKGAYQTVPSDVPRKEPKAATACRPPSFKK